MKADTGDHEVLVAVDRVIFRDSDDGFTVASVAPADGGAPFVATGTFPLPPQPGDRVRLAGSFREHARFGNRFEARSVQPLLPATAEGIRRYLGSGRVKGIGPRLAERLVAHFGEGTLEILEREPERVLEVPGVGRSRLEEIRRTFTEGRAQREALVHLQGLGLGPGLAAAVWGALGEESIARVQADPYALAECVPGIGFATTDKLARAMGIEGEDPKRLIAGVRHVLRSALDQGHVALAAPTLLERATGLLAVAAAPVRARVVEAVERGELASVVPALPGFADPVPPRIYLPWMLAAEAEVAERLSALAAEPLPALRRDGRPRPLPPLDARLSEEQVEAVRLLVRSKVALLTGGPGVGKTTVMRAVTRVLEGFGLRVALACPTGRAAKQLEAATGLEASTLHRLFGFLPGGIRRDPDDPLEADVLVVDETSMLDLPLFLRVLRRLRLETMLLLVGDPDQLPSVGPGNVLADLIASRRFPVARLTRIYRQDRHGLIVENAHRILAGELPRMPEAGVPSDFYFIERDRPEEGARLIRRLFLERMPKSFGLDPRKDIQVLSPMHRGPCGVEALNRDLQAGLDGDRPGLARGGHTFREGDRVMQVRNDHDRGVMNGDLGVVVRVDAGAGSLVVGFDGREESYQGAGLDDLQLAFAMTVHKSQGGEYPAVLLPLFGDHRLMLRRSVLYTAVTRARDLLVLVGSRKALHAAVTDERRSERQGGLRERLQGHAVVPVSPFPDGGDTDPWPGSADGV